MKPKKLGPSLRWDDETWQAVERKARMPHDKEACYESTRRAYRRASTAQAINWIW